MQGDIVHLRRLRCLLWVQSSLACCSWRGCYRMVAPQHPCVCHLRD